VACHIPFKSSQLRLQLCLKTHLNRKFEHKVMGLQNCKNPNFKNFKTPTWESWDKMTLGCMVPWLGTENTIRGKVVTSPKFGSWWVLWVRVCSWFIRAPNVLQLRTNQLVFGLCRSVWIIELLVTLHSPHPGAPLRLSTPKCYKLRNMP